LGGGERINAITLVISGVAAGSNEKIFINGVEINLGTSQTATTPVNETSYPITYAVSYSSGTATVSITNISPSYDEDGVTIPAGLGSTATRNLLTGLTYQNLDSENPTAGQRTLNHGCHKRCCDRGGSQ
jgi:hypothetical protein